MNAKKKIDSFCENKMSKVNLLSIVGRGVETDPVFPLPTTITGHNNGNTGIPPNGNGPIFIPPIIKPGGQLPTEYGG